MTDEIRVDGIFDAKLIRENKSAKGIFLTLEIAADDYFKAKLSDVRPGALLKIGYQELIDVSVQPIEVESTPSVAEKPTEPKPKRAFHELSLATQAGMRCEEEEFEIFFDTTHDRQMKETLVDAVRRVCGVASRAELSTNVEAAYKWRAIEAEYQSWLTDFKYADQRR